MESTLSSRCSRSDPLLSRKVAALAHLISLPPHDLVIWTDGSVPLPFDKCGSGVLANCSFCTEATISFLVGPVCSSFSAEAYAFLQAFCWSRKHQKSAIFLLLLCDSRSVLATLSSLPSFLLPQSLWHIWQGLFFLLYYQSKMDPRTLVSSGNDANDELARRGSLLVPSGIS